jgi:cell division protein FtsZ
MRIAMRGIEELQAYVDTLIIIPNQNLFRVANDRTTFSQAFAMADDVLHSGVRGVTDLIVMPGLINLDFADIKTVMSEMGKAMMGTGEAEGEERALKAAEAAISNPLLDDVSMKGARGVLINITGGADMMLFEVDQAANRIRAEVDPDANIIFGGTILENMEGRLRVSVVATGIEAEAVSQMPKNVEPLRPRSKPVPVPTTPPMPHVSPVHRQVQALASEINTPVYSPAPAASSAVETMILGGAESPVVEDDIPVMPVTMRPAPLRPAPQPEPEPLEEKRRRFGFLGRKEKKPEPRLEPQPVATRSPAPQRATAQVIQRGAEAQRQPQQSTAEDLFPDHKKDDQFEIPAFLRRQTN